MTLFRDRHPALPRPLLWALLPLPADHALVLQVSGAAAPLLRLKITAVN
jgi:hypothetical protein